MNGQAHQVINVPVITEESTIQMESKNQYVFKVHPKANKHQIRDAVEEMFPEVKVLSVNTMNYQGKEKGRFRRVGRRSAWKKAIVTLRPDDHIDLLG
jgi:large subunit ribosomal protein L23